MNKLLFVCCASVVLAFSWATSVSMRVINYSGDVVELYWVNTFDEVEPGDSNLVSQMDKALRNSSETTINSYDTHVFTIQYFHHQPGTEVMFTKGPFDEIIEVFADESKKLYVRQRTLYDQLLNQIEDVVSNCNSEGSSDDDLPDCMATKLVGSIDSLIDSKQTLKKFHRNAAARLRNYTCADESLPSSTPIDEVHFLESDGSEIVAHVLLDNPASKIWYIDNFATDEECKVLMDHGAPRLKRATVAAEDGTSVVSENRKAQQAIYEFNRDNLMHDPLGPLYHRIMQITNAHAGFELRQEGQEHFTIIQYNIEDQYMPHCDGGCSGEKHTSGGRVATAVVYCKVADRGGGITFSNADLYYKPKNGSTVFFSYMGSDSVMDEGLTEHSSCPVLEGEKWAATAWMRLGVTRDDPWDSYDPQGIRILDTEKMDA